MIKFTGNLRLGFEKAAAEIKKPKDRILGYQEQIVSLQASVRNLRRSKECGKKQYAESLTEKDTIIKELQNRLAHAEALRLAAIKNGRFLNNLMPLPHL